MELSFNEKIYWLRACYKEALNSPDPSTQNAGILLSAYDFDEIGRGCNTFVRGSDPLDYNLKDRDTKLFVLEHAERNAIYDAVRRDNRVRGSILVCPWFCCDGCAKCLIQCGVKHIIGHKQHMDDTPDRWKPSIAAAFKMLDDAGIIYEFVDAKIGCKPVLFNGELWYP